MIPDFNIGNRPLLLLPLIYQLFISCQGQKCINPIKDQTASLAILLHNPIPLFRNLEKIENK